MSLAFFDKNASNIYFAYNVGIRTSPAQSTLHVLGDSAMIGKLGIGTTTAVQALHLEGNSYVKGNIGIGTTLPTAILDVSTDTAPRCLQIRQNNSFNSYAISVTTNSVFPNTFFVTGDGKVGVGSSAPAQTLHVQGSQYIAARLGVGTASPGATLHVVGNTMGVPCVSRSAASYNPANPFTITGILSPASNLVFTIDPVNYKVHEIRFMYYSSNQSVTNHFPQLSVTGSTATSYTTNFSVLTNGTWSAITPVVNGPAPTFSNMSNLSAGQCVSGLLTVYNHDQDSGSPAVNISVDINTPVPSRIMGNMKVTTPNTDPTEIRVTMASPLSANVMGNYSITSYPCNYL